MTCKKKAAQGISTDRATNHLRQTRRVSISELKVPHPRKALTRRPTITEIRGCLPNGERLMRRDLRGCSSQLHTGWYRKRVNPAGPRGNEGDKHPSFARRHVCTDSRSGKWGNGRKIHRGVKSKEENEETGDMAHPGNSKSSLDPSQQS